MESYIAEFIGTMVLILFGDGVVAAVLLRASKAENSGWIVITFGWAMAVAMAVYAVGWVSGAHINPAVTIALAVVGQFDWAQVPGYVIAQFLGAFVGAVLVWLAYLNHWEGTADPVLKRGVFCTIPQIRNTAANFVTEVIGTAALLFGILGILGSGAQIRGGMADLFTAGLFPLLVGLLVLAIGLSLGGPTGYAINPARDLGPRIAHAVLPIPGKGDSDWSYSWIPVVAPIVGGIIGAVLYTALGFGG
ncbi:Glycerol uptake facilitator protein [Rubrobacter xylanophilus DSM 9941]|uniref:MIP/aquaporin family protein n=1 Tax=Rubrobacter xylanophilus TaxID=49319 RepID=UPI001C63BF27|nr:MIP/aquaporin family protein [Rubrobacter xylanophilus]QYJ14305.1 Glycerol uptake facilitator protein [Rubrobacter xylanophilus DSM 9941]